MDKINQKILEDEQREQVNEKEKVIETIRRHLKGIEKAINKLYEDKPISEICNRFFGGNRDIEIAVNLTKEEIELFKKFEWIVLCENGLKNISGGYSLITIDDIDEEDNQILICKVECGEQDEEHSNCDKWQVRFNRKTKKFE